MSLEAGELRTYYPGGIRTEVRERSLMLKVAGQNWQEPVNLKGLGRDIAGFRGSTIKRTESSPGKWVLKTKRCEQQ